MRLGLRLVSGLAEAQARAIVAARATGYSSPRALWLESGVPIAVLERLADADAFRSLGLDRRQALWEVKGLGAQGDESGRETRPPPILARSDMDDLFREAPVALPRATLGHHVAEDYATLGLSLKAHPVAFYRAELRRRGVITSAEQRDPRLAGRRVAVAGLVLVRQRPGTAKGVTFLTLEDETGIANVVVWAKLFETRRRIVMTSRFLIVGGRVQREGIVVHVVAEQFVDLTAELSRLRDGDPAASAAASAEPAFGRSRDFH